MHSFQLHIQHIHTNLGENTYISHICNAQWAVQLLHQILLTTNTIVIFYITDTMKLFCVEPYISKEYTYKSELGDDDKHNTAPSACFPLGWLKLF